MDTFNISSSTFDNLLIELSKFDHKIRLTDDGGYINTLTNEDTLYISKLIYDFSTSTREKLLGYSRTQLITRMNYINSINVHTDSYEDLLMTTVLEEEFCINVIEGILRNYLSSPFVLTLPQVFTDADSVIESKKDNNELQIKMDSLYSRHIEFPDQYAFSRFLKTRNLECCYMFHTASYMFSNLVQNSHAFDANFELHYKLKGFFSVKAEPFFEHVMTFLKKDAEEFVEAVVE